MVLIDNDVPVAEHFISAIISGDLSGLGPHEEGQLERWHAFYEGEAGEDEYVVYDIDYGSTADFAKCSVCGLLANCYRLNIHSSGPKSTSYGDSN